MRRIIKELALTIIKSPLKTHQGKTIKSIKKYKTGRWNDKSLFLFKKYVKVFWKALIFSLKGRSNLFLEFIKISWANGATSPITLKVWNHKKKSRKCTYKLKHNFAGEYGHFEHHIVKLWIA